VLGSYGADDGGSGGDGALEGGVGVFGGEDHADGSAVEGLGATDAVECSTPSPVKIVQSLLRKDFRSGLRIWLDAFLCSRGGSVCGHPCFCG
jgi:hypothetical protein